MKKLLSLLCAALAASLLFSLTACSGGKSGESAAASASAASDSAGAVGSVLTFAGTATDGSAVDQSILAGHKLNMVNIWFTECKYCLEEMPALETIAQGYDSADFQLVGICSNISKKDNYMEEAIDLLEQLNVTYLNLVPDAATEEVLVEYTEYAYPTTLFVKEHGEILSIVQGSKSGEAWAKLIEETMAGLG